MKPILILQMQRMGDLILSFPLMLWLARRHPGHPIWVVAEEVFFRELMSLGPQVVYFPWSEQALAKLRQESFELVVNLSHREDAASLAGSLKSEAVIGPVADAGVRRVRGTWQLYRASLTRNNRHNRYHWSELNALDCIDLKEIAATSWDKPRRIDPHKPKVGLFLGASQTEKRPSSDFWAALVKELAKRGLHPFLFGGPGENELCARVKAKHSGRVADYCGKLSISNLAKTGQALSLFITPDTGPMHLAAWTGVATLNLSMGPVNPYETGPYQPGQHVLRPSLSCRGCWICRYPDPPCRMAFNPVAVASLAKRIIEAKETALQRFARPGLELLRSSRNSHGLYALQRLGPFKPESGRELLSEFWSEAFAWLFGLYAPQPAAQAMAKLRQSQPRLAEAFAQSLPKLGRALKQGLLSQARMLDAEAWRELPPLIRPLSGYLHMSLQNKDYSRQAWLESLELIEKLNLLIAD